MKATRLMLCLLLMGACVAGFAPSASACTRTGPSITDKKGDASRPVGGGPSEPQLDLLKGQIKYVGAKKMLNFIITTADIQSGPPSGATGKWFTFGFTFKGQAYELLAISNDVEGTRRYSVRKDGDTLNTIAELKGTMDPTRNIVRIDLPLATLRMKVASVLKEINLASVRNEDLVVLTGGLTADDATSTCSYSVGQEI